jgi:hypothetical protein
MSLAHQIQPNGIASKAIAMRDGGNSLPAMVSRAAQQLASATTAAEVLDARDFASVAYDAAKKAARLAAAKGAADVVIAKAHRAQADALEIEAAAKRRLADEYDAAQERGEVAKQGNIPEQNVSKLSDIGITAKDIHEARQIRDAEEADPGVVKRTVEEQLAAGKEPTKAAVRKAVEATNNQEAEEVLAVVEPTELVRGKLNIPEGVSVEEIARQGLAREAAGENSVTISKSFQIGQHYYRMACDIVFLRDRGGYSAKDKATVERAFRMMVDTHRIAEAFALVEPVALKVWNGDKRPRVDREPARIEQFEHAFGVVTHTCVAAAELDLPYLSAEDAKSAVKELNAARRNLQTLVSRIQELHNV